MSEIFQKLIDGELEKRYDCKSIEVYKGDNFLGKIYPATVDNSLDCIQALVDNL